MEIDFLLIGQGLAGTALGYRLKKAGFKVLIFDRPESNQSSRVAAGLFNPVTGRKMVKTWNADHLFPEIVPFYTELENISGKKFLNQVPIYRPFISIEEQNEWMGNSAEDSFSNYLKEIVQESQSEHLNDPFGGVILKNSGWLNIVQMLDAMAIYFGDSLRRELLELGMLHFDNGFWSYGEVQAKNLVFCNGVGASQSGFFDFLPFAPVKGEILEIQQSFSPPYIVNRGVFRVPIGEGVFRVGSTYTKDDLDQGPTERAKNELTERLKAVVKLPVEKYITHRTGIRPATRDRKPFLGKHPDHQNVYIFDGFGAKGVSLIPFYSKIMLKHLVESAPIPSEVDIARYFNYI